MGDRTGISWTDATWNPTTGCSIVSPGCENCYAAELSLRRGWSKKPWTARNAAENVVLHPDRLEQPLHWRKPRRVFVNSMSDLFHEQIPIHFIDSVFEVMGACEDQQLGHVFQILTKRPERMLEYMKTFGHTAWNRRRIGTEAYPPRNVWLGVSVEDQRRANERIPLLMQTPAAVRFLSCEPLLGPINLGKLTEGYREKDDHLLREVYPLRGLFAIPDCDWNVGKISWVILGGESGAERREMRLEWAELIADDCRRAGVPLYVKQDSSRMPGSKGRIPDELWARKEFPGVPA